MINLPEIMKNISNALNFKCITDIPHFFLVIYGKRLIKTYVLLQ